MLNGRPAGWDGGPGVEKVENLGIICCHGWTGKGETWGLIVGRWEIGGKSEKQIVE